MIKFGELTQRRMLVLDTGTGMWSDTTLEAGSGRVVVCVSEDHDLYVVGVDEWGTRYQIRTDRIR